MEEIGSNIRPGQPLAVVVGAGGLAMAVARRLGGTYRLLLADRDGDHLDRQVATLRAEGHDASGCQCDIAEEDAVQRLAGAASESGPVRALAHVVGISPSFGDGPTILRVNLRGAALIAKAFLPLMAPGSAAVFVSSLAAHVGTVPAEVLSVLDDPLTGDLVERVEEVSGESLSPVQAYSFSKSALNRLCQRSVTEWGNRGLRILSLSPGLLATPMGAAEFNNPAKIELYKQSPLKREGTMIEICDAMEFLLSERASFITDVDLLVDGGLAAAVRNAEQAG